MNCKHYLFENIIQNNEPREKYKKIGFIIQYKHVKFTTNIC